jgi:hypothetical protein
MAWSLEEAQRLAKASKDRENTSTETHDKTLAAICRLLDEARQDGPSSAAAMIEACKEMLWARGDSLDVVSVMRAANLPIEANDFAKTIFAKRSSRASDDELGEDTEAVVSQRLEALSKAGLSWAEMDDEARRGIEVFLIKSFSPLALMAAQSAGMDAQEKNAYGESVFQTILIHFLAVDQLNAKGREKTDNRSELARRARDKRLYETRKEWLIAQFEAGASFSDDFKKETIELLGPIDTTRSCWEWRPTTLLPQLEAAALRAAAGDCANRGETPRRAKAL